MNENPENEIQPTRCMGSMTGESTLLSGDLDSEAGKLVQALQKAGKGREAGNLGEVIGNWRKGRIGDSLLRQAIESAKNRLNE